MYPTESCPRAEKMLLERYTRVSSLTAGTVTHTANLQRCGSAMTPCAYQRRAAATWQNPTPRRSTRRGLPLRRELSALQDAPLQHSISFVEQNSRRQFQTSTPMQFRGISYYETRVKTRPLILRIPPRTLAISIARGLPPDSATFVRLGPIRQGNALQNPCLCR